MKTKAVRLYGKKDLRLEEFELPPMKDDEILAHIISDSICMSSYKAAEQGSDHKRVPGDIAEKPIIIGHEFCGELVEVGKQWQHKFQAGQKFSIQPNLKYKGRLGAPGYSYQYIGGDATYVYYSPEKSWRWIVCLIIRGDAFFPRFVGGTDCPVLWPGVKATYHIEENYIHHMGPVKRRKHDDSSGSGTDGFGRNRLCHPFGASSGVPRGDGYRSSPIGSSEFYLFCRRGPDNTVLNCGM